MKQGTGADMNLIPVADDPQCQKCPLFDHHRKRCTKNDHEPTESGLTVMVRGIAVILVSDLVACYIIAALFGR